MPSANGFTLVELIVVLAILSTLAAISVPAFRFELPTHMGVDRAGLWFNAELEARRRGKTLLLVFDSEAGGFSLIDPSIGDTLTIGHWEADRDRGTPFGPTSWWVTPLGATAPVDPGAAR